MLVTISRRWWQNLSVAEKIVVVEQEEFDPVAYGHIDVGDGCWRRYGLMAKKKLSVTVLAILVSKIHYLFTLVSGTIGATIDATII